MRTTTSHGVSYSIVPFGAVRLLFLSATPKKRTQRPSTADDYAAQIRELLKETFDVLGLQGFHDGVLMLNVFLANIGMKELHRQIQKELFPKLDFVTTYIPQTPADGGDVALDLFAVAADKPMDADMSTHRTGRGRVIEWSGVKWCFGGNVLPGSAINAYRRATSAFINLHASLRSDFSLDSLVRTWLYQGHLLFPEGDTQRYKELNRARTDFFGNSQFLKQYIPPEYKGKVYPASTGIGADDFDVTMSCCALSTEREDVIVVPLENPRQTSAFDYGEEYSPQSPKFARAMVVAFDDSCLIFVSGTAAITDSESRCIDDPEGQTNVTLDNIAALIDSENLERHGVRGYSCGLQNLESVRVYVKRPSEFERIKAVCQQRLGDVPTLYTIADVCRDELLVEIEGIAVCSSETPS